MQETKGKKESFAVCEVLCKVASPSSSSNEMAYESKRHRILSLTCPNAQQHLNVKTGLLLLPRSGVSAEQSQSYSVEGWAEKGSTGACPCASGNRQGDDSGTAAGQRPLAAPP